MKARNKGILLIVCSSFCFALMTLLVKLSGDLPSIQKSFFRNLVAFFFAAIILFRSHSGFSGKKENILYLLIRSVCGTLGILCSFYAVDHLVLADANMLNKMSPFFTILFSTLFLKEKVKPVQIILVVGAFAGSLFIIKPSPFNLDLVPALVGLVGGMGAGAAYTLVRSLGKRGEKGPFVVCFFSGFSCLVTLPYLLFKFQAMTWQQLVFLLLAGVAAAGGQFAITGAYFHAPAREISVYDYSQILFSAALGFLVFGQIPGGYSVAGYVVICAMAIGMFCYNKKKSVTV